jgi:cell division cycle 14
MDEANVAPTAEHPICERMLEVKRRTAQYNEISHISIYLAQNDGMPDLELAEIRVFRVEGTIEYVPFADDFGPLSMSSLIFFIELVEYELAACIEGGLSTLVFASDRGRRDFTNAAFLLGAYMIIRLDEAASVVAQRFDVFDPALFEGYRDASSERPDFRLCLLDCWQGLERARRLNWVAMPIMGSSAWGKIEPDELRHYESRLNADLHEVVPGKLIAMAGPRDLGRRAFLDSRRQGTRAFSPEYYADILRALGVSTVVRLNEPRYDRSAFAAAGFDHVDLFVEDGIAPPRAAVETFLRVAELAPGAVAVHCRSGLGRTGTFAAAYMMRFCGFSARAAMGWMRIMRPGSVMGKQVPLACGLS